MARNALVVGAEMFSRILDWNDRTTCVLFGDGAGAVVLEPSAAPGILAAHLHADGSHRDILCVPGTGAPRRGHRQPLLHMDGGAVFKLAVKVLAECAQEALDACGMDAADIDWLIPHQANIRIMDATAKKLKLAAEKVVVTRRPPRQHVGGVDSAGARRRRARRPHPRRPRVMLLGVGGGFTWGAVLLRWT